MADSDTCPFCKEYLSTLLSPRRLPCKHVGCSSCLNKWIKDGVISCPICREVYGGDAEDYEEISEFGLSSPTGLMCSLCDVDVAATKYCSVCTDKLCLACFETHETLFKGKKCHYTLPIEGYIIEPIPEAIVKESKDAGDKSQINLKDSSDSGINYEKEKVNRQEISEESQVPGSPASQTETACSLCDMTVAAVTYCENCDNALCADCMEIHAVLYRGRTTHTTIHIDVYEQSKKNYAVTLCETHKKRHTLVCERCYKLACKDCNTREKSCNGGEKHIYHRPCLVEDDLRGELAAQLGEVDCLSEKLQSLSEEARQQQEQLVMSREEKIETIRQSASAQIRAIEKERDRLINDVQQYYWEKVDMTQEYSADIKSVMDDITRMKSDVGHLIDTSHITEIIKRRQEMLSQLDDLLSTVKTPLEVSDPKCLVPTGTYRSLELNLVHVPTSIRYKPCIDENKGWYSCVCYTASGDILVGSEGGITRLNSKFEVIQSTKKYKLVTDIVLYNHSVYVLHMSGNKLAVTQTLVDLSTRVLLLDFLYTRHFDNKLSVSDTHIVVTDSYAERLIVYDRSSNTHTRQTVFQFKSYDDVHFSSNTSLLVTSYRSNKLALFDLRTEEVIWSCDQLSHAVWVTADPSSSLIYAFGQGNNTVYIINHSGKKLRELHCKDLPCVSDGMDLQGNQLAVTSKLDGSVRFYTLES